MARISLSTVYRHKGELVTLIMFGWAALAGAQNGTPAAMPATAAAPALTVPAGSAPAAIPSPVPATGSAIPSATPAAATAGASAAPGAPRPGLAAPAPTKHAVAPIALEKPLWKDLTPAQQRALEPLAGEWNKLEGLRKQKWLEIANRFTSMKPDEQQRVHERMRDWLRLTPDQRRQVRENFARSQKITPGQKSAQWEQYQQLPEDQKKQLADKAPKKQVVNPPTPTQSKIQTVAPVKSKGSAPPLAAHAAPGAAAAGVAPATAGAAAAGTPAAIPPAATTPAAAPATSAPASQGLPANVK